jgi:putative ABC transport system permease protein
LEKLGSVFPYLSTEWILLDRTRTTSELRKKYTDIARLKTKATTVDVQTMYESASMIINLEYALNLITLAAVMILFFIIQVGVVNTLRMTIRERTREIGTMRSIGMQKGDVRNIFLLETFFLTFFACLAGIALSFVAMALLTLIQFPGSGNPLGMLLVNHRLHFVPTLLGTVFYFILILAIATATAWFPARKAAQLSPSDALRHFG